MISDNQPPPLDSDEFEEKSKFTWPPLLAYGNLTKVKDIKPFCYNEMDSKYENHTI